jgi:hypothetical protein
MSQDYISTQQRLLAALHNQPTEMVRRHLLYLAERLLAGRNEVAAKQVRAVVEYLIESKPQPAIPPSSLISLLTDVLRSTGCDKVVASRDGSSVLVCLHSAQTEK